MYMNRDYLIIANWKMYLSYNQAVSWIKKYGNSLAELIKKTAKLRLVICPSFDSLATLSTLIDQSTIALGGQDCSAYDNGPYTGQVLADSLAQLGCTYCIIGHGELRREYHYVNQDITKKIEQCMRNKLIPIVCVGESEYEYQQGKTLDVLKDQLSAMSAVTKDIAKGYTISIAYEPIWAIGTGMVPSLEHLRLVYDFIVEYMQDKPFIVTLLYGGSVSAATIGQLHQLPLIRGVLIGKTSTDFQELKNIVLSIL